MERKPSFVRPAIKIAIVAGLVAFTWATQKRDIIAAFERKPAYDLWAWGFLAYGTGVLLAFLRWWMLVRSVGLAFRVVDALRLGLVGLFFNLVIPGAVGGDVVKAALICREQSRRGLAIASVVMDRLLGLLGLFVLALCVGLIGRGQIPESLYGLVIAAAVGTAIVGSILAIACVESLFRFVETALDRRGRRKLVHAVHQIRTTGAAYKQKPWVIPAAILMAITTHALNVLAFFACSRSIEPEGAPLAQFFVIVPLVLLSTAVPLPLGALGLSEQLSSSLFGLIAQRTGAVAMLIFRILQYAGGLAGLVAYLLGSSSRAADGVDEVDDLSAAQPLTGRGLGGGVAAPSSASTTSPTT